MKRRSFLWLALAGMLLAASGNSGAAKPTTKPKPTSKPTSQPVKSNGKRVGIIGDSHSTDFPGTPGQQVKKRLEALGYDVEVNAIGSRSSYSFLKGSTTAVYKLKSGKKVVKEPDTGDVQIEKWLASFDPDYVLIMLGTNDAANVATGGSEKIHLEAFTSIIRQLKEAGVEVIGVGPPMFPKSKISTYTNKKTGVSTSGSPYEASLTFVPKLEALYLKEGADFIDSRPLTSDILTPEQGRSEDGIHFKGKGGDKWAARIVKEFEEIHGP
jgi:lysophospholipase L1-like esterase